MSDNNNDNLDVIQSVKEIGNINRSRTSANIETISRAARGWVTFTIVLCFAYLFGVMGVYALGWTFGELWGYGLGIYHLLAILVPFVVAIAIYDIGKIGIKTSTASKTLIFIAIFLTGVAFLVGAVYAIKSILTIVQCFAVNGGTFTPTTNTTSLIPGSEATVLCSGTVYVLFWISSIVSWIVTLLGIAIFVILLILLGIVNNLNTALLRRRFAIVCASESVGDDLTRDRAAKLIMDIHQTCSDHGVHPHHIHCDDDTFDHHINSKYAPHKLKPNYNNYTGGNNKGQDQPIMNYNGNQSQYDNNYNDSYQGTTNEIKVE